MNILAKNDKIKFNRVQLKYIAAAAMLIDHIGWMFVPTRSILGQIMHFIGRFTAPTMAYFLYEGFVHTSNKKAYGIRLGLFAVISWLPFCSFYYIKWCIKPIFGVIYTLFLGFLAMLYAEKREASWCFFDWLVIIALCFLSGYGDAPVVDVLLPLALYMFRKDADSQWQAFIFLSVFAMIYFTDFNNLSAYVYQLGMLVPPIIIRYFYNPEPGKNTAFNKWFFYIFYPLHLVIITAIKIYL